MAEPHAHSQPIQTYGPAPHNRNIWPHNSRATAAPSRLADSFVCFGGCTLPTTHGNFAVLSRDWIYQWCTTFFGCGPLIDLLNHSGAKQVSRPKSDECLSKCMKIICTVKHMA